MDRSPYSGSIFDVEEETGRIVTKVNLNEDPGVVFKVSGSVHGEVFQLVSHTWALRVNPGIVHCAAVVMCGSDNWRRNLVMDLFCGSDARPRLSDNLMGLQIQFSRASLKLLNMFNM